LDSHWIAATGHPMTYSDFSTLIASRPDGVVLLEGRRAIPAGDYGHAARLARGLALRFPRLRFRSGNAAGSDQAFSEGVAMVDAGRLQVVAPYASHRSRDRYPAANYDSPGSLSQTREAVIAYKTISASPKIGGLINKRGAKGPLAAKAAYLIRDTMKVVGHSDEFPKPLCALFYVDPDDPMAGGTGHTIRVCRQEGVPVVFQSDWQTWVVE